jgi:hypothetical protein
MATDNLPEFDAFAWIRHHFAEQIDLDYDQLRPVLSFSLIWNLFETVACNTRANTTAIRRAVDAAHQAGPLDQPKYMQYVDYFKARYLRGGDLEGMFGRLMMTDTESQVVVRRVLMDETHDTDNIAYGLLLIAHRIRNNLFHGNKGIERLPGQTALFCVVNRLLTDFVADYRARIRGHAPRPGRRAEHAAPADQARE